MYHLTEEFARAHQNALLEEARIERDLRLLKEPNESRSDNPSLRDKFLIILGDWMIALGQRMHSATQGCASQSFSENKV